MFSHNSSLIHAVGWGKSGDEIYKSMPQLQINAVGVVRLIAQGWRQPALGYMCNKEVNAVGVSRYSNKCIWQLKCPHGATPYFFADIPMDVFAIVDVVTMQRRIFNANTSMDISTMMNVTTTQLGTSCSFDSPGLARDEPTPGEHPQGDATP